MWSRFFKNATEKYAETTGVALLGLSVCGGMVSDITKRTADRPTLKKGRVSIAKSMIPATEPIGVFHVHYSRSTVVNTPQAFTKLKSVDLAFISVKPGIE